MGAILDDIGLKSTDITEFAYDSHLDEVKSNAFNGNHILQTIRISNAAQIEDGTFNDCSSLIELVLPGNIETYSGNIFGETKPSNLRRIAFLEGVEDIGASLRGLPALEELILPNTLTVIHSSAFNGCSSITNLDIKNDVNVESDAFIGMDSLNEISFPVRDGSISYGLSTNTQLNSINIKCIPGFTLFVYDSLVSKCAARYIQFDDSGALVDEILQGAFANCGNLLSIDLSKSSISEIPESAFANCVSLTSVKFDDNKLTSIGYNAFANTNVNDIGFNNLQHIEYPGKALVYTTDLKDLNYVGPSAFFQANFSNADLELTNNTDINNQSFQESNVSSIILGDNVKNIPASCFTECSYLQDVASKAQIVREYAFKNDYMLSGFDFTNAIDIKNNAFENTNIGVNGQMIDLSMVDNIGFQAFKGCGSLSKVRLCNSLSNNLQLLVFENCENLTLVDAKSYSNAELDEIIKSKTGKTILVDNSTVEKFRESVIAAWNVMREIFGLPENSNFAFEMSDVALTKTGEKTDWECLVYEDVDKRILKRINSLANDFNVFVATKTMPSNVLTVQTGAFDEAINNFSEFNFQNVEYIGNNLFANSETLTSFSAAKVKEIGSSAFINCKNLANFSIDDIEYVGESAFRGCRNLEFTSNQTFSYLQTIGINAFSGCKLTSNLNLSVFPELTSIPNGCFRDCTHIRALDLRNGSHLQTIASNAFNGCISLTSIITPDSKYYSTIGELTFNGCASVDKLSVQMQYVTSFSENALSGVGSNGLQIYLNDIINADSILHIITDEVNCIASSGNEFGSSVGANIFTGGSKYKHPKYFTVDDDLVLKVCHNAFIASVDNAKKRLVLTGYDNDVVFDNNDNRQYFFSEQNFYNVCEIKNTAFDGSEVQDIDVPSSLLTAFENGVFSAQHCPRLKTLNIGIKYVESEHKDLWRNLGSSNNNLSMHFINGVYDKYGWYSIEDVFKYSMESGVDTIIGVHEDRVRNSEVSVASRHKAIAPLAFMLDSKISSLNTNQISSIQCSAFAQNSYLKKVNLDNAIVDLDDDAFSDCALLTVNIPGQLKNAKGYGLNKAIRLENLTYDNGIESIMPSAMINCQPILTALTFPVTLTSIGEYAFAEQQDAFPRIQNLNFDNLTNSKFDKIEKCAFYNSIYSYNNSKLVMPPHVLSIFDQAFAYSYKSYESQVSGMTLTPYGYANSQVEYIGLSAFQFNVLKDIDLSGSNSLKVIDDYAFSYPKYKYTISKFPNSLEHIGKNAFKGNKILNPDNVKKNIFAFDCGIEKISSIFDVTILADYSADNIAGFTDFTVLSTALGNYYHGFVFILNDRMNFCPPNLSIDIINRQLVSCENDSLSVYVQQYLTSIAPLAFANCKDIELIKMPYHIDIGASAFYDCHSLKRIEYFDDNDHISCYFIDKVADYEFYNCRQLSSIKLLSSTVSIGNYAFYNNDQMNNPYGEVDIPYEFFAMSSIGNHAFEDCDSLQAFSFGRYLSTFGDNVFDNCSSLTSIGLEYFTAKEFAYMVDPSADSISSVIIDKFSGIADSRQCRIVFSDVTYMNDGYVVVDNDEFVGIRRIDENQPELSAVSSLNYLHFMESSQNYLNLCSIYQIDNFAFCDVDKLQSISFLQNLHTKVDLCVIGDYAFAGCINLHNFNDEQIHCKQIGEYAFANDILLTKFIIDFRSLEKIGRGAFSGTSLHQIELHGDILPSNIARVITEFKQRIGWSVDNRNPMQLSETCFITMKDNDGNIVGKYDYLLNDLMHANVDVGTNQFAFIDKRKDQITPILLLKPKDETHYTTLAQNSFHMNVVGRWK